MQRLPDRLSAATQMEDIFERNPAWKRASRRLSTGANDHINVRSTTGPRSTVDVDVRNCWEGGRADAVTALNAHPAYSVSVETFIDAAAEPGVTMVRPRGVLVGVKLSPEELNDDREVGNGNGCERDDEVLAAGDDASASLLEDVLAGAASPSDIDGPTNTILLGGHVVCKASAYYIVFGKGTPKSNDRLKRVRGIGRARTMLPMIDEDDESDMHGLVCPLNVVAVVATVGDCQALCLTIVEELRSADGVESELALAELAQSGTKVTLRLAVVSEEGGALQVSGRGIPFATVIVEGVAVKPLTYTNTGDFGVSFDLSELRAVAAELQPGAAASRKFLFGSAQHKDLVVEGTIGMEAAAELVAANVNCFLCPYPFAKTRTQQHAGAHILDGSARRAALAGMRAAIAGEAASGGAADDPAAGGRAAAGGMASTAAGTHVSLCGWCCAAITEGKCSTTVTNLGKTGTSKFVSNCLLFPGAQTAYGAAMKSNKASPCSNVPILCGEATCHEQKTQFWRYNIAAHYIGAHGGLRVTPLIVNAMNHLDSSAPGGPQVESAKAATTSDVFDSHLDARAVIKGIANEHAAVVGVRGTKRPLTAVAT